MVCTSWRDAVLSDGVLTDVTFQLNPQWGQCVYGDRCHRLRSMGLWLPRYGHLVRRLQLLGTDYADAMEDIASQLLGHCLSAVAAAAAPRPLQLASLKVKSLFSPSLFVALPALTLKALTLKGDGDHDDYLRWFTPALPRLTSLKHLELEWRQCHRGGSTCMAWLQGMTALTRLTSCILDGHWSEVSIKRHRLTQGT